MNTRTTDGRHVGGLAMAFTCIALVVLGGAARAQVAAGAAQGDPGTVPRISVAEIKKLVDAGGVIVLDVRDAASYGMGHMPGAISVPLETVAARAKEWREARKPIVTYCT